MRFPAQAPIRQPHQPIRLSPRPMLSNCPGQMCPERDGCLRWLLPAGYGQRWASYDIERQQHGDCPAKIESRAQQ